MTIIELRRVLKKNGTIYATFVNYYHSIFWELKKGIKYYNKLKRTKTVKIGVLNFKNYTKSDLKKLFYKNRFKIDKIKDELCFTDLLYGTKYNELRNRKIYKELLKMEKDMMNDNSGFGGHLIVIAKK